MRAQTFISSKLEKPERFWITHVLGSALRILISFSLTEDEVRHEFYHIRHSNRLNRRWSCAL
jgi:hypothetical protein